MFNSAVKLAHAIRTKSISPVEVAQHFLKLIQEKNPALNALVWLRTDEFLQEAQDAEKRVMKGTDDLPPFFGVPNAIKDLSETTGQRVTHGSLAAKDKTGRYDTSVVRLMKEAGFLFVGRSNAPEFGTLPVTENRVYGATRNPYNTEHTPGGSSGGAAAAVAAGMLPIAHASDGGGSIRIPASCCGLVGLKASRGRIPKGPFLSEILHGFSVDGCVSNTVEDTAHFLDTIVHYDPTAWYSLPVPEKKFASYVNAKPRRLRIGIAQTGPIDFKPQPVVLDAVTKCATVLSDLGHDVFEANFNWNVSAEQLAKDFITVWCTGTSYLDFADWSEVEQLNRSMRDLAMKQSSHDYIKAVNRLQLFSRHVASTWEKSFDLLLTPTMAMEPPKIGWLYEQGLSDPEEFLMRCTEMVPYCGWCNVTGQPAISVPMSMSPAGLPIGVQLIAPPFREDLLIVTARQLEDAVFRAD
jgi:amidase